MDRNFFERMKSAYIEYRDSSEKSDLIDRLIQNEEWYRMKQTELQPGDMKGDGRRVPAVHSGYLFNAILNKHADAMDNFPDIAVLAREEGDKELAQTLTGVISYILEMNDFEDVYSSNWDSKLKTTSCYGVTWDPDMHGMLGDVKISKVDMLNLSWQPCISNIQDSEFIFYHSYMPRHEFIARYGEAAAEKGECANTAVTYKSRQQSFGSARMMLIVDCYYKKRRKGQKAILHFAKFCGDYLIYASEDEKNEDGGALYPDGYYEHGLYPFFIDRMFRLEQNIAGFGMIDAFKSTQAYIDSIDNLIQINNRKVGKPKYIVSKTLGVSEDDLTDTNKEIVYSTRPVEASDIYKLPIDALPQQIIDARDRKIDEMKDVSGNLDFQRGGTSGGVTSGTAISVLQAAGDKLSRDLIKASYRCYRKIILCVIELIRQFYTVERTVRITGEDGEEKFISFDNSKLKPRDDAEVFEAAAAFGPEYDLGADATAPYGMNMPQFGEEKPEAKGIDSSSIAYDYDFASEGQGREASDPFGGGIPYFDIKLAVQKSNPYSRELANNTILELYKAGLFNPQNMQFNIPILNALQFDGKEALMKDLNEAAEVMNRTAELEQQVKALSDELAALKGGGGAIGAGGVMPELEPGDELVEIG